MNYKKYILILLCLFTVFSVKITQANALEIDDITTKSSFLASKNDYKLDSVTSSKRSISCSDIIDAETKQLIHDVLKYPRYIVPGIVITLGMLDMFKAVTAGKEDEMKKAQKTLIKRVIIGVCVFLVPLLVDVLIWLANIAWEGVGPCPI